MVAWLQQICKLLSTHFAPLLVLHYCCWNCNIFHSVTRRTSLTPHESHLLKEIVLRRRVQKQAYFFHTEVLWTSQYCIEWRIFFIDDPKGLHRRVEEEQEGRHRERIQFPSISLATPRSFIFIPCSHFFLLFLSTLPTHNLFKKDVNKKMAMRMAMLYNIYMLSLFPDPFFLIAYTLIHFLVFYFSHFIHPLIGAVWEGWKNKNEYSWKK